jgi:protein-tyrosine phosphatase
MRLIRHRFRESAPTSLDAAGKPGDRWVPLRRPKSNLRDLGGLPTGGESVRRGRVFRSASLHELGDADVATLLALRIQTIVDLRVPRECKPRFADTHAWAGTVPNKVSIPLKATGAWSGKQYYRLVARPHLGTIRRFFSVFEDPANYPVLFHCVHGKDRTGIMAALLLLSLGTPRELVTADYMLSAASGLVRLAWIEAVYKKVDAAGGIDGFLDACGVGADCRARVARNLF